MVGEIEKHGGTRNDEKDNYTIAITGDVFAELVRHFYLEAILEQNPKQFTKTGILIIDEFCNDLIEESELTIMMSTTPIKTKTIPFYL